MTMAYKLEIIAVSDRGHGGPAIAVFESDHPFMLPRPGDIIRPVNWPDLPDAAPDLGLEVKSVEHFFWTPKASTQVKQKACVWVTPRSID